MDITSSDKQETVWTKVAKNIRGGEFSLSCCMSRLDQVRPDIYVQSMCSKLNMNRLRLYIYKSICTKYVQQA